MARFAAKGLTRSEISGKTMRLLLPGLETLISIRACWHLSDRSAGSRDGMSAGFASVGTYSKRRSHLRKARANCTAFESGPRKGDAVYPCTVALMAAVLSTKSHTFLPRMISRYVMSVQRTT